MRRILPFALALPACQRIDAKEAQRVFTASYGVAADVESIATDLVVGANTKSLDVQADGDGWLLSGTVDGGGGWEGTVEVSGSASYLARTYDLDLDTTFVDVYYGSQDIRMDGDIGLLVSFGYPENDYTGAWNLLISLDGGLDVGGSAIGHADIAYDLEIDFDGSNYVVSAGGTIAGHDVDGMSVGG